MEDVKELKDWMVSTVVLCRGVTDIDVLRGHMNAIARKVRERIGQRETATGNEFVAATIRYCVETFLTPAGA
jgi:hypothetical protein